MAGNGTIGLEIVEDLDGFDAVLVPFGGGGSDERHRERREGAAAGDEGLRVRAGDSGPGRGRVRERRRPGRRSSTRPPSSTAPGPQGSCPEMWPHRAARSSTAPSSVSLDETPRPRSGSSPSAARVVAEGAGAPVAAAVAGSRAGRRRQIVCIVSGGNIDAARLAEILHGRVPN